MAVTPSLDLIATAALSDAQTGLTTIGPSIASRVPGAKLVGPAFTVLCLPGSTPTVHQAFFAAWPRDVLVVDGQRDTSSALFGALMARSERAAGLAGGVVGGAIRDLQGLCDLGFPAFARAVTARVGTDRRLGKMDLEITCVGVAVRTRDWVLGDADGVVVVP